MEWFLHFKKIIKNIVNLKIGVFYPFRKILQVVFFYCFPDSVKAREGFRLFLNKNDIVVSGELALRKTWEETETKILKEELKCGDVFVDIGANIGYYTVLASRIVGERGKVFAIEPDPENFFILEKNVKFNSCNNVVLIKAAVSDVTGKTKLFLSDYNKGQHQTYDSGEGRESIEVNTIKMDDFFQNIFCKRIDLVKMDIEGEEFKALRGMSNLLRQGVIKKIITEFWPRGFKLNNVNPDDYLKMLQDYHFRLFKINEEKFCIEPISKINPDSICEGNDFISLLCVKN